jgi:hypothetical protein
LDFCSRGIMTSNVSPRGYIQWNAILPAVLSWWSRHLTGHECLAQMFPHADTL